MLSAFPIRSEINTDNCQRVHAFRANTGELVLPLSTPERALRATAEMNRAVTTLVAQGIANVAVTPLDRISATLTNVENSQTIKMTVVSGKDTLKVVSLSGARGDTTTLLRTEEFQDYEPMLANEAMVSSVVECIIWTRVPARGRNACK